MNGTSEMNLELEKVFLSRISEGLLRNRLTKCSTWSENIRIMGQPYPGPWTFKYHPWLREMMDSDYQMCVGQKSAQMGYTEAVLNRSLYKMDIEGTNVLYVLPTKTPDASDFSSSRFDPALDLSEHLGKLFSDVKNVGHKRAGAVSLFIRGSKSRAGLKSIPAGLIVMDEVDEMNQDNIPLALERSSGQLQKQFWLLSTPTVEDYGINVHFKQSSQDHFFFNCPHCSKLTELIYPECLVITAEYSDQESVADSHIVCKECNQKLEHSEKTTFLKDGKWVSSYSGRNVRGFYINQLYSSTVSPGDIAKSVLNAQRNAADEQELWNSKIGLPHSVEGARLTETQIKGAFGSYHKGTKQPGITVMGIDVGKWLHYEVASYTFNDRYGTTDLNMRCQSKVVCADKVLQFEELDPILNQYNVQMAVCDIQPERRKAHEFASRNHGRVRLCYYGEGVHGKMIKDDPTEQIICVDRTSWIDAALGRFKTGTITLPMDTQREYTEHLKAPVRVFSKDNMGNPIARYITGHKEDHFAHARTYCEMALTLAAGQATSRTIKGI